MMTGIINVKFIKNSFSITVDIKKTINFAAYNWKAFIAYSDTDAEMVEW